MNSPLVSILIPAYNAASHVAEALESVLGQTYPHLEVIVVDDGSTDGTLAMLRPFGDRGVRVLAQTNAGAAAARNRAYDGSRGDFIKFFDADDLLSPEHVALQVDCLANHTECVAMSEWDRFYRDPSDALFMPQPSWRDADPVTWLVQDWADVQPMTQPGMFLIPRSVAERAGPWDEGLSLTDDFDYFTRAILASRGVRFTGGARLYYRSGVPGALSGRKGPAAATSHFRSLERGTNALLAAEDSDRTRRVCSDLFQDAVYAFYPDYSDLLNRARQRVEELGGSALQPSGPPGFQRLRRLIGWRLARRVQRLAEQLELNGAARKKMRRGVAEIV